MFEECFVESRRSRSAKKPVTVALSIAVHSCVVGALILVPLFQLQVLPQIESDPPLPPFRMPKGIQVITVGPSGTGASHGPSFARPLTVPAAIPSTIEFSAVLDRSTRFCHRERFRIQIFEFRICLRFEI